MSPPRKYDRELRNITLDSLGGTHSPTCLNQRPYVVRDAKTGGNNIGITHGPLEMTATWLPQQNNCYVAVSSSLDMRRSFCRIRTHLCQVSIGDANIITGWI